MSSPVRVMAMVFMAILLVCLVQAQTNPKPDAVISMFGTSTCTQYIASEDRMNIQGQCVASGNGGLKIACGNGQAVYQIFADNQCSTSSLAGSGNGKGDGKTCIVVNYIDGSQQGAMINCDAPNSASSSAASASFIIGLAAVMSISLVFFA